MADIFDRVAAQQPDIFDTIAAESKRQAFEPIEHDVAYKAYTESTRRLGGPKATVATAEEFGNMGLTEEWLDFLSENPVRFSERLRKEWSGVEAVKKIPLVGAGISAGETLTLLETMKRLNSDFDYSQKAIMPQASYAGVMTPTVTQTYNREQDEKVFGDFILDRYEAELRGETWGAKVAGGISALPTYMLEFMITGGLAKMGNTAVQKAGTKLLQKYAATKAGQVALKSAGWTGGVITRASLGFPTHTAKTAVERQLDTELGIRGEENWGTSIAMAWLNTVVQTGSEEAGGAFGPAGRGIGVVGAKALKKLPFGSKLLTGLQSMWSKATGGTAMQFTNKLLEKGGYHGIVNEVGEERLATFLVALFGIEHYGAGEGANTHERILAGLQQDLDNIDVELAVLGAIPGTKFGVKFAGDIASIPSKRHWATIYHGSNVASYDKAHPVDEGRMAEGFKATTKKKEAKKIGQHITALEIDKRRFIEVTDENQGELEALVQQSGVDPGTTFEAGLEAIGYDGIKRGSNYTLFHPNTYLAEGTQVKTQAEVTPAAQQAATEVVEESRADSVNRTQQLRQEEYEQLTTLAEEGDEAAAWRIREMDKEGFEEQRLPTMEVLLTKALLGDEVAKAAIEDGQYKGAREAVEKLEAQGRVDPSVPATDTQVKNLATVKTHRLAKLLGLNKEDRYKIQFDLTGVKSMKDMELKDALAVRDYFIAETEKRGLSTSAGKELAAAIKLHTTQKQVQAAAGLEPVGLKRMLKTATTLPVKWWQTSKRVERLLEQLDGFTEGPLYNSVWKVVHTATVNSRVNKGARIRKFKEVLVDTMTPELQTDTGIIAAAAKIAEEWNMRKLAGLLTKIEEKRGPAKGKRAVRKLVGDSLWTRYVTGARTVVSEATAVDPELSMSASERIGTYLASKNEDSLRHLLAGNLVMFEKPELTLLKIVDSMSDQEKQIAEWILTDLAENFDRANQAAIIGLERELEQQDNYFPIRVLDVDVLKKQDFLSELENKHTKKDDRKPKPEPGETKRRVPGAKRALDLDAFGVYLNHITRIEQFIHMAPVAKNIGQIFNTEDFQQAVNNVTSGHGAGVLNRWLRHCVQGHAMDMEPGVVSQAFLWSRQKGVLFALARNVPSVVRQFISGFNAVAMHPMTLVYTAQHLAMSIDPRYYNMLENRMRELSPEMEVRSFERYFANLKYQAQAAGVLTGRESWSTKALSWQRWADKRTVTIAWNAAYDAAIHSEAVQKQFELDGSEEAAIAYANKMIARTQPMGDIEHLPDYFTGGTVERLLSTFMNQVNNNWNFWAHDIYGMRKAGKISNKMVAYRVLFSNVLPSMMFGAISRGGPPDDWKDCMFDSMAYTISPLFLVGRIILDGMQGFAGGQTSVEEMLPGNFAKTIGAAVRKEPSKVALYGIKTVGGLTGRPSNQEIRTAMGIRDLITGETEDWRRIIYSDWSLTKYGWPKPGKEKEKTKAKFIQE